MRATVPFTIALFASLICKIPFLSAENNPERLKAKPSTQMGIVIEAGSGGSRLHIFSWEPRLSQSSPLLSLPDGNERLSAKLSPGIASFADDLNGIAVHLVPLMTYATETLKDQADRYEDIPIYFYATGGMRQLSFQRRERIIEAVRDFLSNDLNCPFQFQPEFARIISGEEEAIFSWAAANYLMDTLLPASMGTGLVTGNRNAFGILDLDEASTQIAYYPPSYEVLEDLTKFQLGKQKIWNVYTKSHLQFGTVSARQRYLTSLVDSYLATLPIDNSAPPHHKKLKVATSCFYAGYFEKVSGSDVTRAVEVSGPELPEADQLARCMDLVRPLLEMQNNAFCDMVFNGECSIAGSYMPSLPEHGRFVSSGSLVALWNFLELPATASIDQLKSKASSICQMNFADIIFYYQVHLSSVGENLPYFCFLSSYVIVLLQDGFKFTNDHSLTVMEQVNGHKLGWPLGAMLYEMNQLPLEYENTHVVDRLWLYIAATFVVAFMLGAVGALLVFRAEALLPYLRHCPSEEVCLEKLDGRIRSSRVELTNRHMDKTGVQYSLLGKDSINAKGDYGAVSDNERHARIHAEEV